jgi:hypothetical protein
MWKIKTTKGMIRLWTSVGRFQSYTCVNYWAVRKLCLLNVTWRKTCLPSHVFNCFSFAAWKCRLSWRVILNGVYELPNDCNCGYVLQNVYCSINWIELYAGKNLKIQAVLLDLTSGLRVRRNIARNIRTLFAAKLWEGWRLKYCNEGNIMTHTHSIVIMSVSGV